MKTIWKFKLAIRDKVVLTMHIGAKILNVKDQKRNYVYVGIS